MIGTDRQRGSRRRASALLDAMLGACVLTFTVTAFGATFSGGRKAITASRHRDRAVNACYAELEARREAGYSALPSTAEPTTVSGANLIRTLPADLPGATGTLVVRRTTVTGTAPTLHYAATSTDTGRLELDMTVAWQGIGADHGSVTLTSFVLR